MNQIYVESNKNYFHGFVIREADLRRLVDACNEQIGKLSEGEVSHTYTIKYKNGAIATTNDLEALFKEENEGSSLIIRIGCEIVHASNDNSSSIKIDFRNTSLDDRDYQHSVKHTIQGLSRDWVFVTSSLIEERLTKVKRSSRVVNLFRSRLASLLILPVLMFIFLTIILISSSLNIKRTNIEQSKGLAKIEAAWSKGLLKDPVKAAIEIKKAELTSLGRNGTNFFFDPIFTKRMFFFLAVAVVLLLSLYFYSRYYPLYNFNWGGYTEDFERAESVRKLIIGIGFGTVFIGVLVNLLSSAIWDKL